MKRYYALLIRFENDLIKELTVQKYRFPRKLGETINHFGTKFVVGVTADNESELIEYGNKLIKSQNKVIRKQNKLDDIKFYNQLINSIKPIEI